MCTKNTPKRIGAQAVGCRKTHVHAQTQILYLYITLTHTHTQTHTIGISRTQRRIPASVFIVVHIKPSGGWLTAAKINRGSAIKVGQHSGSSLHLNPEENQLGGMLLTGPVAVIAAPPTL